MTRPFDVAVIGGGIVGLATARQLCLADPHRRVCLIEKEAGPARHQSGRNSGVLHSGVYYAPGSQRARLCGEGRRAMERFCDERGIPRETCGKLIVATDASERPRLAALFERATANGVECALVGPERLRELEPHAAGIAALHVPGTGIVDFGAVCAELVRCLQELAVELHWSTRVLGATHTADAVVLETSAGPLEARRVISCAGLHSDRVARAVGSPDDVGESDELGEVEIIPFRGDYAELPPQRRHLCRGLIYPVPDPALPFLGAHLTRTIDGRVECGPNAVLSLAREGYTALSFDLRDAFETLTSTAFARLVARHWRSGLAELTRVLDPGAHARELQRLVPELRETDLVPCRSGIRAQAVRPDGTLCHDFVLHECAGFLHVLNAPSPAATASLAIAALAAERVSRAFP